MNLPRSACVRAALATLTMIAAACSTNGGSGGSSDEAWRDQNQRVIDQHKVGGRERELPGVTVPMTLAAGVPVERSALATVTIAPGVSATLGWGRGALLERVEMQPGAAYPSQTLNEELIIVVQDGSATIDVGGKAMELSKDQVLYLQPGAVRSMKAGSNGWKAFEVYSPLRLDHLALAGQNVSGVSPSFPDQGVTPSIPPGVVVNLNEIQLTPLVDPLAGKTYKRSTGLSRLDLGQERADQPDPHGSGIRNRAAQASGRSTDAHDSRFAPTGRDGPDIPRLRNGGTHAVPARGNGSLGEAG